MQTRTLPVWNQLSVPESISVGLSCPRRQIYPLIHESSLDPIRLHTLVFLLPYSCFIQILSSTFLFISQSFPSSFKHVSHPNAAQSQHLSWAARHQQSGGPYTSSQEQETSQLGGFLQNPDAAKRVSPAARTTAFYWFIIFKAIVCAYTSTYMLVLKGKDRIFMSAVLFCSN